MKSKNLLDIFYFALISILFASQSYGGPVEDFLERHQRPQVRETLEFGIPTLEATVGRIGDPDKELEEVFIVYTAVLEKLIEMVPQKRIYFMGRDMFDLYDIVQILLDQHPHGEQLKPYFVAFPFSRRVAKESTRKQIVGWADKHGIDIQALARRDDEVLFIDHGYSGRIFRKLLAALVNAVDHDEVAGHNSMHDVKAILEQTHFRLFSSWNAPSLPGLLQSLDQYKHTSDVVARIDTENNDANPYWFHELFNSEDEFRRAGLPLTPQGRYDFLVTRIDRRRANWNPRIVKLSEDGTKIAEYDPIRIDGRPNKDVRVDRPRLLREQVQAFLYFRKKEVADRLTPKIDAALKRIKPSDLPTIAQLTPTSSANGHVVIRPGVHFTIGELQLNIVSVVDDKGDAQVFIVEDSDGKRFALKISDGDNKDGVARIKKDKERFEAAKDLQEQIQLFDVPDVIKTGNHFHLREWVDGQTGIDWLKSWEESGAPLDSPQLQALVTLISSLAKKGVYLRDLRASGLVWRNDRWVIVKSRSPSLSYDNPGERYLERIGSRWGKHVTDECAGKVVAALKEKLNE